MTLSNLAKTDKPKRVRLAALKSGPRQRVRIAATDVKAYYPTEVEAGLFEEDSHADTTLLGKGWRVVQTRPYTTSVGGFSDDLNDITLNVVDAITVARTDQDDEVLLRVNWGLHKPDEAHSLMGTFQVRDSGTVVETTPTQHDPKSRFALVLNDKDGEEIRVKFGLRGVSAGFAIRTPTDEDMERLKDDTYEITSQVKWDPSSNDHGRTKKPLRKE